jgi:hypothetical protein
MALAIPALGHIRRVGVTKTLPLTLNTKGLPRRQSADAKVQPDEMMSRLTVLAMALVLISACGRGGSSQGLDETASPARTSSPSPSAWPSPTGSQWSTYTDSDYHFSISYPPGFTFERQHGVEGTGLVMTYRAVDSRYLSGYPPGDIDIGIYTKDADTLAGWVAEHTGPVTSSDMGRYWSPVTNETPVTVAGHAGLSFDWVGDSDPLTLHDTAVFLGTAYVLTIGWWSSVPVYASSMQRYHQQMLQSLQIPATSTSTVGWLALSNRSGQFSLRYPPEWGALNCDGNPALSPNAALGPEIKSAPGMCFWSEHEPTVSIDEFPTGTPASSQPGEYVGDITGTISVTVDGLTGTRQTATVTADNTTICPCKGATQVVYRFTKADHSYVVYYTREPGEPDLTDDFDTLVERTLTFSA